jgi:hypothetical protein
LQAVLQTGLAIRSEAGAALRKGKLAEVRPGLTEPVLRVWQDGAPAILLEVVKAPRADTGRTAAAERAAIVAVVAGRLDTVAGFGIVQAFAGEVGLTTLDGAARDAIGRLTVERAP